MYLITLGRSSYDVGTLQGIKIYIPTNAFNNAPLEHFVSKLKNLVEVFQLSSEAIHVFHDDDTSSITFNCDGALFFNLKFYLELHEEECKTRFINNAMIYWFMTVCHREAIRNPSIRIIRSIIRSGRINGS